jgi:hypothetical protein
VIEKGTHEQDVVLQLLLVTYARVLRIYTLVAGTNKVSGTTIAVTQVWVKLLPTHNAMNECGMGVVES